MAECRRVGIVGAGMMGAEIALCFAASGSEVSMKDETLELEQKGKQRLDDVLNKAVKKGRFKAEEKDSTLLRVTPTDHYSAFKDMDLVIEVVFEDLETKRAVVSQLDKICRPDCVFATNTSSIPITLLATSVKPERMGRFLGAHFFSPASVMKLVEVIPGLETKDETVNFWWSAAGV